MGIGCQVDFARCDTGIQLSQPVTPVTKTLRWTIGNDSLFKAVGSTGDWTTDDGPRKIRVAGYQGRIR